MITFDFTFNVLVKLYKELFNNNYLFTTVRNYINQNNNVNRKLVILRHDVDRFISQTIQMAKLEASLKISSTYYFRIIDSVFKDKILKEVVNLGHEIGYHYEDLSLCKGNYEKAIESFKRNLERARKYYPVNTICMHGSPASYWNNKNLWDKYDYKKYGIIADTSLDIDYNKVFYITDNGFGWNKTNTSIRDKVKSNFNIPIRNTNHLIDLLSKNRLPNIIMLNAHPDTFFNPGIKWFLNYGFIKSKNIIKWAIVKTGIYK